MQNNELRRLVEDFDHLDPVLVPDPYPVYAEMRQQCPVAHGTRHGGFWALMRYADVNAAAKDSETFCSSQGNTVPHWGSPLPMVPMESDPPEHADYRHMLTPLFSPGAAKRAEPEIRKLVRELMDPFVGRGHADLAKELAKPLPALVIAWLMGFPSSVAEWIAERIDLLLHSSKAEDHETNMQAALELAGYIVEQIESRKQNPTDDVLGQMVRFDLAGRRLNDDELLGMAFVLISAGLETTVGGIGMMLMTLALHPEARERLIADRGLVPSAVEESLRYTSPVQNLARTVTKDVTVEGTTLSAGEKVLLMWASANRDEREFPEAERFIIDRSPNNHVAFGTGRHRCLGLHLARMEMQVVLEEVLDRMPHYRIADLDAVVMDGGINRLTASLPVTWDVVDHGGADDADA